MCCASFKSAMGYVILKYYFAIISKEGSRNMPVKLQKHVSETASKEGNRNMSVKLLLERVAETYQRSCFWRG